MMPSRERAEKILFLLGELLYGSQRVLPSSHAVLVFGAHRFVVPKGWADSSLRNLEHVFVKHDYDRIPGFTRVPRGSTVVDLGAYVGFFSVKVHSESPGARLVAVEANPQACRYLRHNLRMNGVRSEAYCLAVGESDGVGRLFVAEDPVNSSLLEKYSSSFSRVSGVARVAQLSLSSLWRRLDVGHASLLKVDVEGVEERVLRASRDVLTPGCVDRVVVEVHPPYSSPSRVVELLERGFHVATYYDYEAPFQVFVYGWAKR